MVLVAYRNLLLSQVVTRLDFASRDKDSKPEGSGGPEVLGVKWEVCCVPQDKGLWGKVRCLWASWSSKQSFMSLHVIIGPVFVLLTVGPPLVSA